MASQTVQVTIGGKNEPDQYRLHHHVGIPFTYALFTLAWTDRGATGIVPLFSNLLVGIMLIASMLLFARLVQRLTDLQITSVLNLIGDKGRDVIREAFEHLDKRPALEWKAAIEFAESVGRDPITQILTYSGPPRTITKLNIGTLVEQARRNEAVIEMVSAVGDTLVEGSVVLHIHGGQGRLSEKDLMRAIDLGIERTFQQDPKYPLRLLVDIAIKALSPAINDPTTAVQAVDQIEDLLRRLGRREVDAGHARDANGVLRLIVPMPTWEDYLTLAFDEIRQYGGTSVQVMRRLRAALIGLTESLPSPERADAVRRYLKHLNLVIERSPLDDQDKVMAFQEDRQGLGLSRRRATIEKSDRLA